MELQCDIGSQIQVDSNVKSGRIFGDSVHSCIAVCNSTISPRPFRRRLLWGLRFKPLSLFSFILVDITLALVVLSGFILIFDLIVVR
jgi:hypothetical protein